MIVAMVMSWALPVLGICPVTGGLQWCAAVSAVVCVVWILGAAFGTVNQFFHYAFYLRVGK
jgi:hypothetical protein